MNGAVFLTVWSTSLECPSRPPRLLVCVLHEVVISHL